MDLRAHDVTRVRRVNERGGDALVAFLAEALRDHDVVATGVASPLAILAIAAARATHAPNLRYLACVGSLDPKLDELYRTPEDLRYLEGRTAEISIPDLFDHARRGRIDTVFFGAAQVDATGATNMTAIGSLTRPKVKLPGLAGAATLRRWVRRPLLVVPKHTTRTLVPLVDVASTSDERPTTLITELGVFVLGPEGAVLMARQAWVDVEELRARTGFPFTTPREPDIIPPPTPALLDAIRRIDTHGQRHTLVG